ncbi:MAG: hypothetical protein K1Y36_15540 [Blastocatellia bacterium]|nr:hypothetical protein [Blastocatellia bacterium]
MKLEEVKEKIEAISPKLLGVPFVVAHTFCRNERNLQLALTERFRKAATKGRVWKSPAFLTALKNAAYGFDEQQSRSLGGADGVFLLDRSFKPENEMMRKIFDRFLDKPGSGAAEIAQALETEIHQLLAVRVVSHHMRLLGVLHRTPAEDFLVLVDFDTAK